jgi:hypothetical protein
MKKIIKEIIKTIKEQYFFSMYFVVCWCLPLVVKIFGFLIKKLQLVQVDIQS